AGRAGLVVPRPDRSRGGSRRRGGPFGQARAAGGGRVGGAHSGGGAGLRARPRDLARLRGVQHRAAIGAGGFVRPAPKRASACPRSGVTLFVKTQESLLILAQKPLTLRQP